MRILCLSVLMSLSLWSVNVSVKEANVSVEISPDGNKSLVYPREYIKGSFFDVNESDEVCILSDKVNKGHLIVNIKPPRQLEFEDNNSCYTIPKAVEEKSSNLFYFLTENTKNIKKNGTPKGTQLYIDDFILSELPKGFEIIGFRDKSWKLPLTLRIINKGIEMKKYELTKKNKDIGFLILREELKVGYIIDIRGIYMNVMRSLIKKEKVK